MELTRRDAAIALVAIGASGGAALGIHQSRHLRGEDGGSDDGTPSDDEVRVTMIAVAEVVYPDQVAGIETFIRGFLDGRLDGEEHATGIRTMVAELNERAGSWYGDRVADLSVENRDRLLREVGADTAEEDPNGTTAERVRYYVVNEMLLALYASPKGGELVGIENPQGHPGGIDSYTQGPPQ
jgi:hypothetical protein